ncbi:MAG: peptidase M16 [Bacteroidetes bacterium GWF2_33_16]|nr:MAG: peptidase M16 [Bacteroidetes bacterium GWE2_32_14]OFY02770.1 MAG: peptidase M16 [Bacteroidetes bacterium GWF2_33_16]
MIKFDRFILENGLKVIVHNDTSTTMVAVNILYNVGARDESPDMTGFAHLFEHLMFEGSKNIPSFDTPLQLAGGENNAYTTNDITNYYITIPKENLETAFWLESDRMLSLGFSQKKLDIQKSVVIEEYNQRYLNQPYGDAHLYLRPLAYKVHPYQWATIGKDISHIQNANLENVKDFFEHHYAPNSAILSVAGNITKEEIESLAIKWFGPIKRKEIAERNLPKEPKQTSKRTLKLERNVPFDAIYKAFHMSSRHNSDYNVADLISDLLSNGKSSRLYQQLVKEKQFFSSIDAYITGDIDEGLFIISGNIMKGISIDTAEAAIENELKKIYTDKIDDYELNKVKNKFESVHQFGQLSAMNKAMDLAYQELLGDANLINHEVENYRNVSANDIKRVASQLFDANNCSTLYYIAK